MKTPALIVVAAVALVATLVVWRGAQPGDDARADSSATSAPEGTEGMVTSLDGLDVIGTAGGDDGDDGDASRFASKPRLTALPEFAPSTAGYRLAKSARPLRLTRAELYERAERVDRRATQELQRLTGLLELSEEQQDRIFPLLARGSSAYHPSLGIEVNRVATSTAGGAVASPDSLVAAPADPSLAEPLPDENKGKLSDDEVQEKIGDELTPEQRAALEDEMVERDLWWGELVTELEDELDAEIKDAVPAEYDGNAGVGALLGGAAAENSDENVTGPDPAASNGAGSRRSFSND